MLGAVLGRRIFWASRVRTSPFRHLFAGGAFGLVLSIIPMTAAAVDLKSMSPNDIRELQERLRDAPMLQRRG
jgi:hypothetical protein